jgi:hypothetical protein
VVPSGHEDESVPVVVSPAASVAAIETVFVILFATGARSASLSASRTTEAGPSA